MKKSKVVSKITSREVRPILFKHYPKGKVDLDSIGMTCRASILQGMNFKKTLIEIKKTHKKSHFSISCYYGYRQEMKRHGISLPVCIRTSVKGRKNGK